MQDAQLVWAAPVIHEYANGPFGIQHQTEEHSGWSHTVPTVFFRYFSKGANMNLVSYVRKAVMPIWTMSLPQQS
jgi:hypothetical protein